MESSRLAVGEESLRQAGLSEESSRRTVAWQAQSSLKWLSRQLEDPPRMAQRPSVITKVKDVAEYLVILFKEWELQSEILDGYKLVLMTSTFKLTRGVDW